MSKILVVSFILLFAVGMTYAGDSTDVKQEAKKVEAKADSTAEKGEPEMITTESGLKYTDLVVGTGKEAVNGMNVQCHYTLWFADENEEKGQMVQSSKEMGQPFTFEVGNKGLIKGWNEGMLGMKEGGTRKLIIPSELGYGATPPPGIPKNQTLIFELEFLKAM